jgi:hypothetical protein
LDSLVSFITSHDYGKKICDALRAESANHGALLDAINSLENKFLVQSAVQRVSSTLRKGHRVTYPLRESMVQSSLLSQYASPLTLVTLQVGAHHYLDRLIHNTPPGYPSLKTASDKIGSTIENMLKLPENAVSTNLLAYYGKVIEEGIKV